MRSKTIAEGNDSLSAVGTGETVELLEIRGGQGLLSRLATLGFTPGAHLQVVQNYGHGPIIVRVRDTRVALGRGEANKILVKRLAGGDDGRQG